MKTSQLLLVTLKKEGFRFHAVLIGVFQEVIALSIDGGQISYLFVKIWPIKTAKFSFQRPGATTNWKAFWRSWAFCRKRREDNCLKPFVIFVSQKRQFSKRRVRDQHLNIWIHSKKLAKKSFVLYVERVSSVQIKQHDLMLNFSVFTIGLNLQFFNCH